MKLSEVNDEIRKLKSPKESKKENVILKTTNNCHDFLKWL
jgi:hypothetical protein